MRTTAIDFDFSVTGPSQGRRARRTSLLSRIHWPRLIALLVSLAMWPAIIFAVSRFF
jgi:hypothetical protein